ncbi:MAG: LLM class flavin-dependent oxidoreductase [Sphingomonadales bacterium]|nr:LLM class flavin-dependent oxidoreductase [Sphingomonadales bacterium]
MLEIWRAGGSNTGFSGAAAEAVEAEGWDGQMFMDSQALSADPYVLMGAWAGATRRLKLGTGVTNPLTRNLAVTAAAAASVQAISGGRAVLGIGRGDSALAYLGLAPAPLAGFERALTTLQALLSGAAVDFATTGERGESRSAAGLSLGARPDVTQLKWLPQGLAKVPLDVAATGPKVIAMGARIAERVTFSVGADPERLRWALALGHAARAEAGLPADGPSWGAQLLLVCHPDADTALEVAMAMAPPLARFQVMEGAAAGPGGGDASLAAVRAGYDMTRHGEIGETRRLTQGALSPDFVRRFAVVGPPDHCLARLAALRALGIDRFVIVGPGFYPEAWGTARDLFAREVMPALRAHCE